MWSKFRQDTRRKAQAARQRPLVPLFAFPLPLWILVLLMLAAPAWSRPSQEDIARQYGQAKAYYQNLAIRYWSNNYYTRLVVETTAPVTFKHQLLVRGKSSPDRIYLDLRNSRLSPETVKTIPIEDGLLHQVRSTQFDPKTVRVVLDTQTNISEYKVFTLTDPFRVVIDVPRTAASGKAEALTARQPVRGLKRIVIDPGHGGKD